MRMEKIGDWGSLIHDSNEMSQAVESQRQQIPRLRLYYSFHHKSDGSKGEQRHKWLPLKMGKMCPTATGAKVGPVLITIYE